MAEITLENPRLFLKALKAPQSHMLGQATAALQRKPLRWIQQFWGVPDVHTRQKWATVWPCLASLPPKGIRLLDAGCGTGRWSLELSMLYPGWTITGIDYDSKALEKAEAGRRALGLNNVSFSHADFLQYAPGESFDVVLSIASAHYLGKAGLGPRLFMKFGQWLSSEGTLLLYGPRRPDEAPLVSFLGRLSGDWGFSSGDLRDWSAGSGLRAEAIVPQVGRLGTFAKQIAISAGSSLPARLATYPLQLTLTWLDWKFSSDRDTLSSAWLLIATKTRVNTAHDIQ